MAHLPVRRITRHALDRNTFRQSARGLTILRGAPSPILPFRHPRFLDHSDTAVPYSLIQGRHLDQSEAASATTSSNYITPANLLHTLKTCAKPVRIRPRTTYFSVGDFAQGGGESACKTVLTQELPLIHGKPLVL